MYKFNISMNYFYDSDKNYYIINTPLDIYEDECHEFKMLQVKDEESIENFLRLASKYICAYLNTNEGCLHFGISDDGIVKGVYIAEDIYYLLKNELSILIQLFCAKSDENLITFKFFEIYKTDENTKNNKNKHIKIDNYYVVTIFTKKGCNKTIYSTPYKDPTTKDYECFIKLNGTTHKLSGYQLQKYIKNKVKMYYLKNKD